MRLTYFGHSAFLLELAGHRLVFDPWLRQNAHGAVDPASVPCDLVLVSHAHDDHLGDALELARLHGATIVAPFELAEHLAAHGAKTIDLMPGGGVELPWGRIDMTPAVHSSALELGDGKTRSMGVASGYVVHAGGRTLYHAGDTALFGDMRLIARHGLDVALIPIGDFYTMGPVDAIEALHFLRPRLAVPMHFNSNEKIRVDAIAFAAEAARAGHRVRVMAPRETLDL
ncbi:MAG TPA: metal-dependent hydrolase [Opitutus sp.]|nr:metal-dependent hydrolase [Opitutus sp.]